MPSLPNPLLLSDFLSSCLDQGGLIGMLALNGIFILVTRHGLEYPHFYARLYALLQVRQQPSLHNLCGVASKCCTSCSFPCCVQLSQCQGYCCLPAQLHHWQYAQCMGVFRLHISLVEFMHDVQLFQRVCYRLNTSRLGSTRCCNSCYLCQGHLQVCAWCGDITLRQLFASDKIVYCAAGHDCRGARSSTKLSFGILHWLSTC